MQQAAQPVSLFQTLNVVLNGVLSKQTSKTVLDSAMATTCTNASPAANCLGYLPNSGVATSKNTSASADESHLGHSLNGLVTAPASDVTGCGQ